MGSGFLVISSKPHISSRIFPITVNQQIIVNIKMNRLNEGTFATFSAYKITITCMSKNLCSQKQSPSLNLHNFPVFCRFRKAKAQLFKALLA